MYLQMMADIAGAALNQEANDDASATVGDDGNATAGRVEEGEEGEEDDATNSDADSESPATPMCRVVHRRRAMLSRFPLIVTLALI